MVFFVAGADRKLGCSDAFATHAGHLQAYERI
jgi:hypothetical protein